MGIWDRYAAVVTARRSWVFLLALVALATALMVGIGGNDSAGQAPKSLPDNSSAARAAELTEQFPDAGSAAAIVVVTRADGAAITDADRAAATEAVDRATSAASGGPAADGPAPVFIPSQDGQALLGQIPVSAELNGEALTERVEAIRTAATEGLPEGVRVQITGGPAFGADIADSFSGANTTLLGVTALVVAILLILTYRSPVLWLVPLLVIGIADRLATTVGTGVADLTGLSFDGSTSGITSVLVFGAGTNYALLLVSRYRDELHRHDDHRDALREAVRRAGPAILASNLTVVAALLVLVLASVPSTRSLGVLAASGLLVALVFVLLGLPPALALCGRNIFWPFVPRPDERDLVEQGIWHTVATRVVARPVIVTTVATAVLGVCAAGLFTVDVGLTQTEQFRVRAESVDGFDTLAAHFPSGSSDPVLVVAPTDSAAQVDQAITATSGVVRATRTGDSPTGLTRWSVVIDAAPATDRSFEIVTSLRDALDDIPASGGTGAVVGGSDAEELDIRTAAERDRAIIIPLILAVVCAILLGLLRAVPAALLLVVVTVFSAVAALGLGSWMSTHLFGFPGIDTNVPLFAFLFLVALGVDYTIFLVTRAREETPGHGTTGGIVRAVSATGSVITSAGIVLAAVFCVLGILPLITLTQLGIVVGLGILLDTFVVRTLIIPALFSLIGPKIWWPSGIDTRTSPGAADGSRAPLVKQTTDS